MALAMVYRVRKAFDNVNIISTGGAFDYKDAIEFLMAGANLVGIGAAAMVDFDRPIKILNGMKKFLEERGLNINDILSSAHRGGI
jgi:dihydroorotate dehydrogenase (NAD+) catalytic subunit